MPTPAQSGQPFRWAVRWETSSTTRFSTRWWSQYKAVTTWPSSTPSVSLSQNAFPRPAATIPHGQALDATDQVMFVGCESNATMVTVDLINRNVIDHHGVGETPDVLAYDPGPNRVYVAAESGWVSIFDHDHGHLTVRGSAYLADGAHSLALDPTTHHTYIPIAKDRNGSPVLREYAPT